MLRLLDQKVNQNPQSSRINCNKLENFLKKIQNQHQYIGSKNKNCDQTSLKSRCTYKEASLQSLTSRRITQFQSDKIFDESNIIPSNYQLPKIQQKLKTISKANYSQERISLILQKNEQFQIKKRMTTDCEMNNQKDKLNIKKLEEQLGNQQYQQNQILSSIKKNSYPGLYQLNDLSKQMQQIYKKNNINPVKMIFSQKFNSPRDGENSKQSIEYLIQLLKETSKK